VIFGYCQQFSITSTEQAFRDVTCKPCSLSYTSVQWVFTDKVLLTASRIALACLSSIHNDTPDHGSNVRSVVRVGKPRGRLAKLAVNVKHSLEQLVSSVLVRTWPAAPWIKLVASPPWLVINKLIAPTSCYERLSSPGSHQSCRCAIYGLDLSMPSSPAVGKLQWSLRFAGCLSLLRQLVASCNEACCSFASCYTSLRGDTSICCLKPR